MKIDAARKKRLAVVVSHPIQHWVSFYRALEKEDWVDVHVIYGSRLGLEKYYDTEMGHSFKWNMDLLSGYSHRFLPGAEKVTNTTLWQLNNPHLGAALSEYGPDAVLIYGYNHANALRAIAWCRRNNVQAIMLADSELKQHRAGWKSALKALALPRLYKRFDDFITIGDENERYYRRYGVPSERLHRGTYTIDEAAFEAVLENRGAARASVREEFGIPNDAILFLFVGKFSERKRPHDPVRALRQISGGRPVHLLMAGTGALLENVRQEAADLNNVTLAGFVNVDRLPAFYAACDVLVHSSSRDPHPVVCTEAAICGVPLILSDRIGATGPTDVARPGQNAIIYPCGDVEALARAMNELATDDVLRSHMSKESRRIFGEVDMRSILRATRAALDRYAHSPRRD